MIVFLNQNIRYFNQYFTHLTVTLISKLEIKRIIVSDGILIFFHYIILHISFREKSVEEKWI